MKKFAQIDYDEVIFHSLKYSVPLQELEPVIDKYKSYRIKGVNYGIIKVLLGSEVNVTTFTDIIKLCNQLNEEIQRNNDLDLVSAEVNTNPKHRDHAIAALGPDCSFGILGDHTTTFHVTGIPQQYHNKLTTSKRLKWL